MTRRQLILVYCITLFMIIWGFDLLNAIKYNKAVSFDDILNPFQLSQVIYAAACFLLTHLISRRYFLTKKYLRFALAIAALLIFFIFLRYLLEEVIYASITGFRNYPKGTRMLYYALDNIYYAFIYITLGFLLFLLDSQLGNQKKQALLIQQSREAELQFLRSQINPHFLFNTLNNIYSLVYEQSPKAPAAMLQLSDLMRYMLYEKKDKVPVQKEWAYIQNFITLQKLRFDFDFPIQLSSEGDDNGKLIAPYLLIPFIENAFKHGDFKDPDHPLRIRLLLRKNELVFETANKINRLNKDETGGVGLDNVRRRLELLYPGQHKLETKSEGDLFSSHLLLKL